MDAARKVEMPVFVDSDLELRSGDRVEGLVRNDVVQLKVVRTKRDPRRTPEEIAEIRAFLDDFTGRFKNPDYDPSGDERAMRILGK